MRSLVSMMTTMTSTTTEGANSLHDKSNSCVARGCDRDRARAHSFPRCLDTGEISSISRQSLRLELPKTYENSLGSRLTHKIRAMAEKKRKPNSAKYRQSGRRSSPDLNGGIANGTSINPDPAAANSDASDRLFYEELNPTSEARCEHACPNHRPSSKPRLSRAALVATAALVVGIVAVVAVGVVIWHDHQRQHHQNQPRVANVTDNRMPLSKGVRTIRKPVKPNLG